MQLIKSDSFFPLSKYVLSCKVTFGLLPYSERKPMDTLTPTTNARRPEDLARERITVEPGKCGGRPCIRGMRIRVTDVLGMLAAGMTAREIIADFPNLDHDDIIACLSYAAAVTEQRLVSIAHVEVPG
jgi:uncharacterized protein (DUF433 family)